MKKVLGLVTVAALIAVSTAAFGGIATSKHDLSSTGAGTGLGGGAAGSSTQICVYCHAPHNAIQSLPLWNRSTPTGPFTLYSGVGMANVSFQTGFTSDSTSLFCMSCHDGVTTMSAIHNAGTIDGNDTVTNGGREFAAGTFNTNKVQGNGALGTANLKLTHPINFPVSETDTQLDLHTGTGASMGKTNFEMPLFKSGSTDPNRTTANRSLECGSCHAVHNDAISPFLRYTMAGSQLCLGCHNK